MSNQDIFWTVLPNGWNKVTNNLRLSVFITPKLNPVSPTTLDHFPDFLDWPKKLNALLPLSTPEQGQPPKHASLQVNSPGNPKFELRRVSDDYENDKCSSAMWAALFNKDTTVKKFGSSDPRTIRSYPIAPTSNHLKRHYLNMFRMTAQAGLEIVTPDLQCPHAPLPWVEDLRNVDTLAEVAIYQPARPFYPVEAQASPSPISGRSRSSDDETERRIARSLRRLAQHPSVQLTQEAINAVVQVETRIVKQRNAPDIAFTEQRDDENPLSGYVQMLLMHRRRTRARTNTKEPRLVDLPCDFHSYLSLVGEYPWLLRRLCLVLDFEVLGNTTGLPSEGCAQLVLPERSPGDKTPWTAYAWNSTDKQFNALPADSNYIKGRMLNLSDADTYAIERLDVEGGAIKTIHFQDALHRTETHFTADTPKKMAPPSLRSVGFSVVQKARGARLAKHIQDVGCKCTNLPAGEMIFCAEDLTRGLRVDVWDKVSGKWHSLCRRRGHYVFDNWKCDAHSDNKFNPKIEPEGIISPTLTRPVGEPSESNSPPEDDHLHEALFRWEGWSLCAPRPGKGFSTSSSSQPKQRCDLGIHVKFDAEPGSLPALRFREDYEYKFRARIVDLAGNSLAPDEVKEDESYAIPDGDGIQYCRFDPIPSPAVILTERLNPSESPSEMLNRLVLRSGGQNTSRCQRLVVPPKGTAFLAELCGNLDASSTGVAKPKPDAYHLLTDYDADFEKDANPDDPNDPSYSGNPIYTPYEFKHGKTPDRRFRSPYLADPLSYGATISFHDFVDSEIPYKDLFDNLKPVSGKNPFSFYYDGNEWPEVRPFLVRLVNDTDRSKCNWDFTLDGRVLTVALPPGQILKVRLSSNPSRESQSASTQGLSAWHGFIEWLQEAGDLNGESLPRFTNEQYSYLTAAIQCGKHSFVTPYMELTLVHAVEKPLIVPQFTTKFWAARSIGSTLAELTDDPVVVDGHSTVKLDVLARWNEPVDDETLPEWGTVARDVHVCEIPVSYGDVGVSLNYKQDLSPSGTKYRRISYHLSATSRFTEYFKQGGNPKKRFTVEGPEVTIELLNTARPDVVKAPFVIPTFEWSREFGSNGSATTSVRKGGGLRVYFDRPWFSTGEGELLGAVVCSSQVLERCMNESAANGQSKVPKVADLPDPDEAKKPYVTQWGVDPIWSTESLPDLPGQEHFHNLREFRRGLSLAELPDDPNDPDAVQHRFGVAAFDVQYDKDRRLWYSDIVMDARRSYYPFVRLALVRYQPNSVFDLGGQGCHLSQVVLADFAQLAPDRWATVSRAASDTSVFHVTVYGVTPQTSTQVPKCSSEPLPPTFVTVSLERATSSNHDDGGDFSWVTCGTGGLEDVSACSDNGQNESVLPLKSFHEGISLWSGQFSLPHDWKRNKNRVVIREYEQFCADGTNRSDIDQTSIKHRLVYADVLPL